MSIPYDLQTVAVPEAAQVLGCHPKTLYRKIREGKFPGVRPLGSRNVRVRLRDLDRQLEENTTKISR